MNPNQRAAPIRVGVGGWDYAPWKESFYPPGLAKAKRLEHAASRLTAIEVNATFYKLQKPETFARWAAAVPDGFKFAVKGSRFCTNRKMLGEAGEAVARFCGQGLAALGDRLGPINWQLAATKRFDPDDIAAFLALLPRAIEGVKLSHVIEPRHESFREPAFVAIARAAGVGIVCADAEAYPQIADASGGIVYARLQRSREEEPLGYASAELDRWADAARGWSRGESPPGLSYAAAPAWVGPRDVYLFLIAGAKERNPAAAHALIERLAAG